MLGYIIAPDLVWLKKYKQKKKRIKIRIKTSLELDRLSHDAGFKELF